MYPRESGGPSVPDGDGEASAPGLGDRVGLMAGGGLAGWAGGVRVGVLSPSPLLSAWRMREMEGLIYLRGALGE